MQQASSVSPTRSGIEMLRAHPDVLEEKSSLAATLSLL